MAISAQRLPWRPPPTRHPGGAGARPVYRPRHPAASALYAVVQHHIEAFLAHAAEADPAGYGVPTWAPPRAMRALRGDPWVEKDLRDHASRGPRLHCGILAYGFARAGHPPKVGREGCGHERLIAFSCKGRGICPSCNARRMAELTAHLTDHVLPHLPARQWVLSVPKRLRPYLHHNPEVAGAVLGIFLRAIRTTLRRTSPGATPDAQLGAVSFLHRAPTRSVGREVLPLLCSGHRAKRGRGAEMRTLAFLTDPPVVSAILLHLESGPPRNARCVG